MPLLVYLDTTGKYYQDTSPHSPNDSIVSFPSDGVVATLTTSPVAEAVMYTIGWTANGINPDSLTDI